MSDLEVLRKSLNKSLGDTKEDPLFISSSEHKDIEVLDTGIIALNNALGVGGLPKGRIVEIYGPEASGKTTITLIIIAALQKIDPNAIVAFIDVEHALDKKLAQNIGVDTERWLFAQPNNGEQALEAIVKIVESGKVQVVVLDSVAHLTPKAELEGEMDDIQMGAQARIVGKAMRKLVHAISTSKCVVIFINQLREKLGSYGSPETTPGGRALKFAASVRLDVRSKEPIMEGQRRIGNHLNIKVVKNKVAPPFEVAEVDLVFGKGVDSSKDLVKLAISSSIVSKNSNFLTYKDVKGNGIDNFLKALSDAGLKDTLEKEVQAYISTHIVKLDSISSDDKDPEK